MAGKEGKNVATANIAFANLRAEMARKNINTRDIAQAIQVARSTAGYKLARKQPITIDEAFMIVDTLFPEYDIRYLFAEAAQKNEQDDATSCSVG